MSTSDLAQSGTIILESDITMVVDSGNSSENVTDVWISSSGGMLSEAESSSSGCNQPTCYVDVSHLDPGIYLVEAETDLGNSFFGYIVIN